MGFAKDLKDATDNSPAVPKVGFVTTPKSYTEIGGTQVKAENMDICARVISVFKCHKACPLTSANSIAVAASLKGSIVNKLISSAASTENIPIGHPSGVITMCPEIEINQKQIRVLSVAVQRTARRIMDGNVYVRK